MANFPRAGVLQAPMTNVYQMQQDIEANDPLRQALGLAGDVASRYNKKSEYAQAAGMLDAPQTIGQKIGGVAKSAWNAIAGGTSEEGKAESPSNVLKAPNWSEMARIDPERARFDRSTFENEQAAAARANEMKQKQELAGRELDVQEMKAISADTSLDDLRAMYNALQNQKTAMYGQGYNNRSSEMRALDKRISFIGKKLSEKGLLPSEEQQAESVEAAQPADSYDKAVVDAGRYAMDEAKDSNNDGIIDNITSIERSLNNIFTANNLNPKGKEWTTLQAELASLKANFESRAAKKTEKEATAYSRGQQAKQEALSLQDKKAAVGALTMAFEQLAKNPNDKTYKSSALTSILRKESGAAIGASEFMGRMKEWLPPEQYQKLQDEMSGPGMLIAGKLAPNAADIWQSKLSDKYLDYIDTGKLLKFMDAIIPDYAKSKSKSTPPAAKTNRRKATLSDF